MFLRPGKYMFQTKTFVFVLLKIAVKFFLDREQGSYSNPTLCVCIDILLLKKKILKLTLSISKKTTFNLYWKCSESHPDLTLWIDDIKHEPNKGHCKVCNSALNLSNMGRQVWTSHIIKSIKHQNWIMPNQKVCSMRKSS